VVMNSGRVEQEGMPLSIYDSPRTRFVAGFLGMDNLLPVQVLRSEGEQAVVRVGEGAELAVPLAGPRCERMTLAFRAECVCLSKGQPPAGPAEASAQLAVPGTVEFITNLGSRVVYEVRLPGGAIVCAEAQRTDRSREFAVGEPLTVTLKGEHCLLFGESGATR